MSHTNKKIGGEKMKMQKRDAKAAGKKAWQNVRINELKYAYQLTDDPQVKRGISRRINSILKGKC